jgi:cytochrome c oxidase cbb3-type subunit III
MRHPHYVLRCAISVFILIAVNAVAQTGVGEKATIAATQSAVISSKEDAAAVTRGGQLFASNCASCHGATSKGITGKGPDLVRSIYVLTDEKGILLLPVIRDGRPDKGMPKSSLTDDQIHDVAAWLRVQAYGAGHRTTYSFLDILTGDAKKGEAYFNGTGRCNTCHSPTGDLAGIASRYTPQALQTRWIQPRGGRGRGPAAARSQQTVTVTLADGKTVSGVLDRVDDFNVSMRDSSGAYHSFNRNGDTPKVVVVDPVSVHTDMLKTYTDTDIHNVTAYLVTLK